MTNQRLISDARRRARALSVETGRPYQTHLDDVARLAGRADWKAFVADPAPISPVKRDMPPERADTNMSLHPTRPRLLRMLRRRTIARCSMATFVAMLLFAVASVATRPLFSRDLGSAIALDQQRRTVATLVLPTLQGRRGNAVNAAVWRRPNDRRDVLLTIIDNRPVAPTGLLDGMKRWATGFPNAYGPGPAAMIVNWVRTGQTQRSIGSSSMGLYHSYFEHPVGRTRYIVDCSNGAWRMTDVQTADDFVSPAAYSVARNGAPPDAQVHPRLTMSEREALCSTDVLERTRRLQAI